MNPTLAAIAILSLFAIIAYLLIELDKAELALSVAKNAHQSALDRCQDLQNELLITRGERDRALRDTRETELMLDRLESRYYEDQGSGGDDITEEEYECDKCGSHNDLEHWTSCDTDDPTKAPQSHVHCPDCLSTIFPQHSRNQERP